MIGIVITGHGHFPSGILSAVELVAGKPENVVCIDFTSGQSSDELKEALTHGIVALEGEDVLILADLVGGTPFNMSAMVKQELSEKNIRLIAGLNMPALVEAVFSRGMSDLDHLADMVKTAGVNGVVDFSALSNEEETVEFDGGL